MKEQNIKKYIYKVIKKEKGRKIKEKKPRPIPSFFLSHNPKHERPQTIHMTHLAFGERFQ